MTANSPVDPTTSQDSAYITRRVQAPGGDLHVIDKPGNEPAIVLVHGFPDDWRIYQKLLGHLSPRRAIAFDFLGYGHSARPEHPHASEHEAELTAVLDTLALEHAVLVGHDAGGPVAVNVTLDNPGRVGRLVLMNTYYGSAPELRFPEMIRLFADPAFTPLADAMTSDPDQRMWLLAHTGRQFGLDPLNPDGVGITSVVPQFFGETDTPDALVAIRAWTAALFPALADQDATIASGQLATLDVPVSLIYGARDTYLNPGLARHLATLFRHADLHLLDDASHWPQADQPETVAQILTTMTRNRALP